MMIKRIQARGLRSSLLTSALSPGMMYDQRLEERGRKGEDDNGYG